MRPRACCQRIAEWVVRPIVTAIAVADASMARTWSMSASGRPVSGSAMSARAVRTACWSGAAVMVSFSGGVEGGRQRRGRAWP